MKPRSITKPNFLSPEHKTYKSIGKDRPKSGIPSSVNEKSTLDDSILGKASKDDLLLRPKTAQTTLKKAAGAGVKLKFVVKSKAQSKAKELFKESEKNNTFSSEIWRKFLKDAAHLSPNVEKTLGLFFPAGNTMEFVSNLQEVKKKTEKPADLKKAPKKPEKKEAEKKEVTKLKDKKVLEALYELWNESSSASIQTGEGEIWKAPCEEESPIAEKSNRLSIDFNNFSLMSEEALSKFLFLMERIAGAHSSYSEIVFNLSSAFSPSQYSSICRCLLSWAKDFSKPLPLRIEVSPKAQIDVLGELMRIVFNNKGKNLEEEAESVFTLSFSGITVSKHLIDIDFQEYSAKSKSVLETIGVLTFFVDKINTFFEFSMRNIKKVFDSQNEVRLLAKFFEHMPPNWIKVFQTGSEDPEIKYYIDLLKHLPAGGNNKLSGRGFSIHGLTNAKSDLNIALDLTLKPNLEVLTIPELYSNRRKNLKVIVDDSSVEALKYLRKLECFTGRVIIFAKQGSKECLVPAFSFYQSQQKKNKTSLFQLLGKPRLFLRNSEKLTFKSFNRPATPELLSLIKDSLAGLKQLDVEVFHEEKFSEAIILLGEIFNQPKRPMGGIESVRLNFKFSSKPELQLAEFLNLAKLISREKSVKKLLIKTPHHKIETRSIKLSLKGLTITQELLETVECLLLDLTNKRTFDKITFLLQATTIVNSDWTNKFLNSLQPALRRMKKVTIRLYRENFSSFILWSKGFLKILEDANNLHIKSSCCTMRPPGIVSFSFKNENIDPSSLDNIARISNAFYESKRAPQANRLALDLGAFLLPSDWINLITNVKAPLRYVSVIRDKRAPIPKEALFTLLKLASRSSEVEQGLILTIKGMRVLYADSKSINMTIFTHRLQGTPTIEHVRALVRPTLENLNLSLGFSQLSNAECQTLAESFQNLKELRSVRLNLYKTSKISRKGLGHILQSLSSSGKLQNISINCDIERPDNEFNEINLNSYMDLFEEDKSDLIDFFLPFLSSKTIRGIQFDLKKKSSGFYLRIENEVTFECLFQFIENKEYSELLQGILSKVHCDHLKSLLLNISSFDFESGIFYSLSDLLDRSGALKEIKINVIEDAFKANKIKDLEGRSQKLMKLGNKIGKLAHLTTLEIFFPKAYVEWICGNNMINNWVNNHFLTKLRLNIITKRNPDMPENDPVHRLAQIYSKSWILNKPELIMRAVNIRSLCMLTSYVISKRVHFIRREMKMEILRDFLLDRSLDESAKLAWILMQAV